MKQESHKVTLFMGLPRQGWFWLCMTMAISILIHLISLINIEKLPQRSGLRDPKTRQEPGKVTVKLVSKKQEKKQDDDLKKRIVEAPMTPTEAPDKPKYMGAQDHKTEKETRVAENLKRPKGMDPGQGGQDASSKEVKSRNLSSALGQKPLTMTPERLAPTRKTELLLSPDSTVVAPKQARKPRNVYESLIPGADDMKKQVAAGYQDYIEDQTELGDRIDLNTSSFRYLSYFTSIRKALEMTWTYPSEAAQRGFQGEVRVEWTIRKDGTLARVKVLESSGYPILDNGVVEAIRLAAPYPPLPDSMNKDKLTVVWTFRYILTAYAGAL